MIRMRMSSDIRRQVRESFCERLAMGQGARMTTPHVSLPRDWPKLCSEHMENIISNPFHLSVGIVATLIESRFDTSQLAVRERRSRWRKPVRHGRQKKHL